MVELLAPENKRFPCLSIIVISFVSSFPTQVLAYSAIPDTLSFLKFELVVSIILTVALFSLLYIELLDSGKSIVTEAFVTPSILLISASISASSFIFALSLRSESVVLKLLSNNQLLSTLLADALIPFCPSKSLASAIFFSSTSILNASSDTLCFMPFSFSNASASAVCAELSKVASLVYEVLLRITKRATRVIITAATTEKNKVFCFAVYLFQNSTIFAGNCLNHSLISSSVY